MGDDQRTFNRRGPLVFNAARAVFVKGGNEREQFFAAVGAALNHGSKFGVALDYGVWYINNARLGDVMGTRIRSWGLPNAEWKSDVMKQRLCGMFRESVGVTLLWDRGGKEWKETIAAGVVLWDQEQAAAAEGGAAAEGLPGVEGGSGV